MERDSKESWRDRVRKQDVLIKVDERRCLMRTICLREKNWIVHVLRGNGLLKDMLEGRMFGMKRRGRLRVKMMDNLMGKSKPKGRRREEWESSPSSPSSSCSSDSEARREREEEGRMKLRRRRKRKSKRWKNVYKAMKKRSENGEAWREWVQKT